MGKEIFLKVQIKSDCDKRIHCFSYLHCVTLVTVNITFVATHFVSLLREIVKIVLCRIAKINLQ